MRIFIDSTPLYTGHQHRGIGMYTRQLIKALKDAGQDVITPGQGDPNQADIIHYPFFDLFRTTLPLQLGKKIVVTIHDVIPLEFPTQYRPGIKGTIGLLIQQLSLKFVDAVITDSEYSKHQIAEHLLVNLDAIHVVPLAGNPELTVDQVVPRSKLNQTYKLPNKYILYVGDINYNKNIPQLIEAVHFLPKNVCLVCIGQNFREQAIPEWAAIQQAINHNGVKDRVIFINDVGQNEGVDIASIYHHALCYVQPSLSEGFGLPVLEALQCQTPVVCTDRGSLPEVGGNFVLYADPSADALAADINEILGWTQLQRTKHIKAGATWAAHFSWRKTAQQTIDVYNQVLS